ncbi:MAG: AAA family ATPase, partial [Pseudomonadota bacterium]|nr:AAA family ATPase [Pseudomonadota bacterium]
MKTLKDWRRDCQRHRRLWLPGLLLGGLLGGFAWLYGQALHDVQMRRSAEALAFESAPEQWLTHERSASEFRQALDNGLLSAVGLVPEQPGLVLYTLRDGSKASTRVPGCGALGCAGTALERLGDRSTAVAGGFTLVALEVDPRPISRRFVDAVDHLLGPLTLLVAVGALVVLALRRHSGMGGQASRLAQRPETRFADVVGNEEAKAALQRVRAFMQDPSHYARLGALAPRGVLLTGPPGTGKTLLAKALAGETRSNFIAVDGSYFTAMFYGAGVAKVKELFKLARKHAPCVLFIDEVDGIGRRSQGGANGGGAAESELNRIINRVLVEMDGFDALDNVVVVAATNHEEQIDEALRRPGRFDMLVRLAPPTLPER